jgi:MFS family permease
MNNFVIYFFPFCMDIVVSLLLFVGRHSLASQGASEAVVGSIPLFFGVGYFLAGPVMRYVISRKFAKAQMLMAIFGLAVLSAVLAFIHSILLTQVLFCIVPFGVSLFFNAFQSYMLGISNDDSRPLAVTIATYTFAWSMGFALGPFSSGLARNYLSWAQTYLIAALVACVVGVVVILFKPSAMVQSGGRPAPEQSKRKPLFIPGWIGIGLGVIGWVIITTYWPIIAERAGFSPNVRGLVEFIYAISQGLMALALIAIKGWQHKPAWLIIFGLAGAGAMVVFGFSSTALQFLMGAALYGMFTATTFSYAGYHAMLNAEKASKRVAINETCVGLGYVAGPMIAALCHHGSNPFDFSFSAVAGIIAGIVAVQTIIAYRQARK